MMQPNKMHCNDKTPYPVVSVVRGDVHKSEQIICWHFPGQVIQSHVPCMMLESKAHVLHTISLTSKNHAQPLQDIPPSVDVVDDKAILTRAGGQLPVPSSAHGEHTMTHVFPLRSFAVSGVHVGMHVGTPLCIPQACVSTLADNTNNALIGAFKH